MAALSDRDEERLSRLEREAQYGITIKDLFWLLRLARRLLREPRKN